LERPKEEKGSDFTKINIGNTTDFVLGLLLRRTAKPGVFVRHNGGDTKVRTGNLKKPASGREETGQ